MGAGGLSIPPLRPPRPSAHPAPPPTPPLCPPRPSAHPALTPPQVLVNLTNHRPPACDQLLHAPRALPVLAAILAAEFLGAERRGGLPRHFDTALMCLGLLTNTVEARPAAQRAIGDARADDARPGSAGSSLMACANGVSGDPGGDSSLLYLLASVLRSLLQPLPPEPTPSAPAASALAGAPPQEKSTRHMEREVAGAYTALLLGFLCRGCEPHCARVLRALGSATFAPVSQLLRSFLQLHSSAGLLSPEGTQAMTSVIEWMEAYGALSASATPPAATPRGA